MDISIGKSRWSISHKRQAASTSREKKRFDVVQDFPENNSFQNAGKRRVANMIQGFIQVLDSFDG